MTKIIIEIPLVKFYQKPLLKFKSCGTKVPVNVVHGGLLSERDLVLQFTCFFYLFITTFTQNLTRLEKLPNKWIEITYFDSVMSTFIPQA